MAKTRTAAKPKRMSDAAVSKATGKTWSEWFGCLDKAGARKMNHREIVSMVKAHGAGPWWQQMVTVEYERSRGKRKIHEKADGMFSISRSKTVPVPLATLYRAWAQPAKRNQWLKEPGLSVRKAIPNRSLRMNWVDGKTDVITMFLAKGEGKSQVSVEHNKLATARDGEKMKKFWGERLEQMVRSLQA